MLRPSAIVLCLGLTSCAVRVGTELRSSAPPANAAPVARNTPSTPVATPRDISTRGRTLGRRLPRATPSAPASPSGSSSSIAQLCVDEINRYRATLGLRPLARAAEREGCADGQIHDDAESGKWHGSYGRCGESLQNECMSSPTAKDSMIKGCLRDMWGEGPGGGHYEAMKNESATQVWCGFYTKPNGDVWSVQDFR